jgi:transposase
LVLDRDLNASLNIEALGLVLQRKVASVKTG